MITQIVPLNVKQKTSRNKKKHTPILKLRKEKIIIRWKNHSKLCQ